MYTKGYRCDVTKLFILLSETVHYCIHKQAMTKLSHCNLKIKGEFLGFIPMYKAHFTELIWLASMDLHSVACLGSSFHCAQLTLVAESSSLI